MSNSMDDRAIVASVLREDAHQKSGADCLAGMDGDRDRATVGAHEADVAALPAGCTEGGTGERPHEPVTCRERD